MTERWAEREFGGAELGDRRLDARLVRIGRAAIARPDASLPKMMGTDAELEATYRFLSHPHVRPEQVLCPHVRQTVRRCAAHETVWVAHDSTDIQYGGDSEREGLGRVRGQKAGYQAHVSIAVEPAGDARRMLGALEVQRLNATPKGAKGRSEQDHWLSGVRSCEGSLAGCTQVIHLMDRAADSYALWAQMCEAGQRFVIRLSKSRRVGPADKLFDRLEELGAEPAVLEREVVLSRRGKQRGSTLRKIHPPRKRRPARLQVRARSFDIPRPQACAGQAFAASLCLRVVHVREVDAPEDCEPVDWKLITTEPIDTPDQVATIVDAYRGRWVIEEYFKALKTGCALQSRQLASYEALSMVLALLVPVAWRLLHLRTLAEAAPDTTADSVLTPLQLRILRNKARDPFPADATVADAHFAIARLGGFLKHNKRPGWQVLARGFEDLLVMEQGASAVIETRCDQSSEPG